MANEKANDLKNVNFEFSEEAFGLAAQIDGLADLLIAMSTLYASDADALSNQTLEGMFFSYLRMSGVLLKMPQPCQAAL